MDDLKLHIDPTSTASWKRLINEALVKCHRNLNDDVESYLIFLLIRFTKHTELANSVLALEYLESQNTIGINQQHQLRDIGDKCLLFSGFYPEQAHRRLVNLEYFVNMGRGAYDQIANGTHNSAEFNSLRELFAELSNNFINLLDVLQHVKFSDKQQHLLLDEVLKHEKKKMIEKQIIVTGSKPNLH